MNTCIAQNLQWTEWRANQQQCILLLHCLKRKPPDRFLENVNPLWNNVELYGTDKEQKRINIMRCTTEKYQCCKACMDELDWRVGCCSSGNQTNKMNTRVNKTNSSQESQEAEGSNGSHDSLSSSPPATPTSLLQQDKPRRTHCREGHYILPETWNVITWHKKCWTICGTIWHYTEPLWFLTEVLTYATPKVGDCNMPVLNSWQVWWASGNTHGPVYGGIECLAVWGIPVGDLLVGPVNWETKCHWAGGSFGEHPQPWNLLSGLLGNPGAGILSAPETKMRSCSRVMPPPPPRDKKHDICHLKMSS